MRPYYEHGGITIYHGDCREVLPSLTGAAVVTDPPYGVSFRGHSWDSAIPADWLDLALLTAPVVLFSTGTLTLWDYPRPDWVLCWARPASNSRSRIGGFSHWSPIMVYGKPDFPVDFKSWHAIAGSAERELGHPTPKPEHLMRWLVDFSTEIKDTVIDPFMGSGTTLRAAKDLGRNAIGIEIEEKYCEIAARRLAQEVLNFAEK